LKGISPIIAIIIILLITIAIAGAAYAYISIIWGRTTEGFQLVSSGCTAGNATFTLRNIGTNPITTLTMTRTSPSGSASITADAGSGIEPGVNTVVYDEACPTGSMCVYKIFAGGQSQEIYAQC
jgi:flagellin-like protein